MQHVLELVMQLRTGEVTAGLNQVESQINRVIQSLAQFSQSVGPTTLVNPQNVVVLGELNEALKTTERYTGLVHDRNVEAVVSNLEYLENAVATGEALRAQGVEVENLSAAEVRRLRLNSRLESYLNSVDGLIVNQADVIQSILNDNVKWHKITQDQLKNVKEMVKHFEAIEKAGKSIEDEFGLTTENVEKMKDFTKEFDKRSKQVKVTWGDIKGGMLEISKALPGMGEWTKYGSIIDVVAERNNELNQTFEANRAIVNAAIPGVEKAGDLYDTLADISVDASKGVLLYKESQKALTAILAQGAAGFFKHSQIVGIDKQAITDLTKSVGLAARVTGVNEDALATLSHTMIGLTGNFAAGGSIVDMVSGAMEELGMSTGAVNSAVQSLSQNLAAAKTFMDPTRVKEFEAATFLASKAAQDAGVSVNSMNNILAKMADPLERVKLAPLIQDFDALQSGSPESIIRAMAKEVTRLRDSGVDEREISAMLKAYQIDPAAYQGLLRLNTMLTEGKLAGQDFVEMGESFAKAGEEMENKMPTSGAREMANSVDELKNSLTTLNKSLNDFTSLLGRLLQLDIAKWIIGISLGFMALMKIAGPLKGVLGGVFGIFGRGVKAVQSMGKAAGGMTAPKDGFFAKFAKSLKEGFKQFEGIKWMSVLKAATMVALMGVALGVGVAAIGGALWLMPPGRMLEFVVVVSTLVIASKILAQVVGVGPKALLGAAMVALVGAALAAGLALIGLALNLMPPDRMVEFAIVTAILVGAAIVMSLLAMLGPMALLGAAILVLVGAALAGALALIGLALGLMPPDKMAEFLTVTITLVAVTAAMSLLAMLAPLALIGAVLLIAVGAALAAAIALLGLSLRVLPKDADKRIGSLVNSVKAMALMAKYAPMALLGSVLFAAAAIPLAIAIGILKVVGVDMLQDIAAGLMVLGQAMSAIGPSAGSNMAGIAGGLLAITGALTAEKISSLFGDTAESARSLGEAMLILKEPIRELASLGEPAGRAFASIGQGLANLASALKGGGIMEFFTGDTVENAKSMATAMKELSGPIGLIARWGMESAQAFNILTTGVRRLQQAINEGMSVAKAKAFADALRQVSYPIAEMMEQFGIEGIIAKQGEAGKSFGKTVAEELKTGLATGITVSAGGRDDEIVERLDRLIELYDTADMSEVNKNTAETVKALERLLSEQIFNGGNIGQTSANTTFA